jgi:hypothetical protein
VAPTVTLAAEVPSSSQLLRVVASDPQAEGVFSGVDAGSQMVPLASDSDKGIPTRGVHKNLPGDKKNPEFLVSGPSEHFRIDWARKEKNFSLFGDKFSWNSKINSCSQWVSSFLDDAGSDKEFGNNSNIKVVLPPGDHVKSKNNGNGWKC